MPKDKSNFTRADIEKARLERDADGNRVISLWTAESIYQILKSNRGEVGISDLADRFRSDNAVEIIDRAVAAKSEADAISILRTLGTKTQKFAAISDERCRRIIERYHRDNGSLLDYRDYQEKRRKLDATATQPPDAQPSATSTTDEHEQNKSRSVEQTVSDQSGGDSQSSSPPVPLLLSSPEGKRLLKLHSKRERNPKLAKEKKRLVQAECGCLKCVVCEFDFSGRYGPHGDGFIECHHTKPLSDRLEEEETRLEDLELVCANCHRMLHRGKVMLSILELRAMLRPAN